MANGNNIYSSQPSSGLDSFSDGLVGNQFTDGSSQFTMGNFGISVSITDKQNTEFSLGNFSKPITLDVINLKNPDQTKVLANNQLKAFINYDPHKVTDFTLYGSLAERMKVATQSVVKNFPAGLSVEKVRADFLTGQTATNILYDAFEKETTLNVNVLQIKNPFAIEFTTIGNLFFTGTTDGVNEIRNFTKEYGKYSLFLGSNEYQITDITPATSNVSGSLIIIVEGNPFSATTSAATTTTTEFVIRPNTLNTEETFDELDDIEKILLNRESIPLYTAKFDMLRESNTGALIKSTKSITWPLTDNWNILIDGFSFTTYLNSLNDIAITYDSYKTNLISRFLTTGALKEFDTEDQAFEKVLQIYGRSFDEVKKYIDGLAYMTNVTYDKIHNVPDTLLKNLAQMLGWGTPSSIAQTDLMDALFNRGGKQEFKGVSINKTPTELNLELYRKILVNTAYLFKSKGTRKSIEFLLRLIGAPQGLIEFNEHVYLAGNRINVDKFNQKLNSFSGGTYTEDVPVRNQYFSVTPPVQGVIPIIITGYTYGVSAVTRQVTAIPEEYPVGKDGYPVPPTFSKDGYFQAGAGWFERTPKHKSDRVVDEKKSVFTGNSPSIVTEYAPFTYGEKYLDYLRKFPDMDEGYDLQRIVDNKKAWVISEERTQDESFANLQNRVSFLRGRGTRYYTHTDRQILNVKNVDLFLNVGQGLTWDVWNTSNKFGCLYGLQPLVNLNPLYPSPPVGPDWTPIQIDASKLSFFEFADSFWKIHINVKNRLTIDDGHGGGYPTLQMVYLDYLNSKSVCGIPTNQYTYEKMLEFVDNMEDYWVRLVEQMVPATTIWQGGTKIENSAFHRYKYAYKHEPVCDDLECLGSWVECVGPRFEEVLVNGHLASKSISFSGAGWYNKITLNGQSYTGPIYYSSTTISDIPTTDLWLNNMVNILSGITGQCFNYWIFDDTTTGIPPITNPRTIVVQGCCSGGTDLWGPNGPSPGTFLAEACLSLNGVYASIASKKTEIYAFYDTTSTPGDTMFAAKAAIDTFSDSLRMTGWSGKTYHLPVHGGNSAGSGNNWERWLEWSSYPYDGLSVYTSFLAPNICSPCWGSNQYPLGPARRFCEPENGGFAVWPDQVPILPTSNGLGGAFSGGHKDVIVVNFVDETQAAYYDVISRGMGTGTQGNTGGPPVPGYKGPEWGFAGNAQGIEYGPPMGVVGDWSRASTPQPTTQYVQDFRHFVDNAHPTFDFFRGLVYPMVSDNLLARMDFPLHVYGAMETGWCTGCIFTNNPADQCFQYNTSGGTTLTGYLPFREWSVQDNYIGNTVCQWTSNTGDTCFMMPGVTGFTAYTHMAPCVQPLKENGTVLAAGGTLSAITQTNPYADGTAVGGGSSGVILSGTNVHTGYMGAGLKNFGWDWVHTKGMPESCHQNERLVRNCTNAQYGDGTGGANPCYQGCVSYPGGPGPCGGSSCGPSIWVGQGGGCNDYTHNEYNQQYDPWCTTYTPPGTPEGIYLTLDTPSIFMEGAFSKDLLKFLEGDTTLFIGDYDYCEPICTQPCEPDNYNTWLIGYPYDIGDVVQYADNCYRSLITGNTVEPAVGVIEAYTGNSICGPYTGTGYTQTWELLTLTPMTFDGGNNFRPREDCTDLIEIPAVPEYSGTGFTTNPVIFKDGIYNIGGQDCFDSSYMVGADFLDPCSCEFTVMSAETQLYGVFSDGIENRLSLDPGSPNLKYFDDEARVCCGADSLNAGQAYLLEPYYHVWVESACTYEAKMCAITEPFNWSICNMQDSFSGAVAYRCWSPCDVGLLESTGREWTPEVISNTSYPWIRANSAYGGGHSRYLDMGNTMGGASSRPSTIMNSPGNLNRCICKNSDWKSVIYDAMNGLNSLFPSSITNFKIEGTAKVQNNMPYITKSLSQQQVGKIKADTIGMVTPCCIGDKIEIINHIYSDSTYLGIRKWEVDLSETTEFYLYRMHREVLDRCFLRIPKEYVTFSSSNSSLDNPTMDLLNPLEGTDTEIILELQPSNTQDFFGLYQLNGTLGATFMTSPAYWGNSSSGDLMTWKDLENIFPNFTLNGNRKYGYQIEVNLICNGLPADTIEFNDKIVDYGGLNTIDNDIPSGKPCPTNLRAPLLDLLPLDGNKVAVADEITSLKSSSLTQLAGEGGLLEFNYQQYFNRYHPSVDTEDYEIIDGNIYAVINNTPYKSGIQIPYNLPSTNVVTDPTTFKATRTALTYTDKSGYEKVKLNWFETIIQSWPSHTTQLFFRNETVRDGFTYSLTSKQIGNVEYFNLYNPEYTTVRGTGIDERSSSTMEEVPSLATEMNFSLSATTVGTNQPTNSYHKNFIKYKNLNDWVERTLGNAVFSNSYARYRTNGDFDYFEIRKDYSTPLGTNNDGINLYTPLKSLNVELLATTYGDWKTFKRDYHQLTGLTSQYTGYTNLGIYNSGSTNNTLNSDLTFDLVYTYSGFTGTTVIPMNGPTASGAILQGTENTIDAACVKPQVLSENGGPLYTQVNIDNDYIYYKILTTGEYRFQYQGALTLDYYDTGWCEYLRNYYKIYTNYTYPSNDYHYKNLVNSSILYVGGGTDVTTQEGYDSNPYTNISPYWRVTPSYGFSQYKGIDHLKAEVWLERKLSGSTSAITLTQYVIGNNSEVCPTADKLLTLDVTPGDLIADTYNISGTTCGYPAVSGQAGHVFTKIVDISLDTKCIKLNVGDEIRLKHRVNWSSSSKMSGTTSLNLRLGTKAHNSQTTYPWYRITADACNTPKQALGMVWDVDNYGNDHIWWNEGTKFKGKEKGSLFVTTLFDGEPLIYAPPINNQKDILNLTYLDVSKKYRGMFELGISEGKTARWNNILLNGGFINAVQPYGAAPFTHSGMMTYWTMPRFGAVVGETPAFPNYQHTYLVETIFRVKGTKNTFSHIVYYNDNADTTINYFNRSTIFGNPKYVNTGRDHIVQNRNQTERKMYFSLSDLIIDGEVINLKGNQYNLYASIEAIENYTSLCECRVKADSKVVAETKINCKNGTDCKRTCREFCKGVRPNQNMVSKLRTTGINPIIRRNTT